MACSLEYLLERLVIQGSPEGTKRRFPRLQQDKPSMVPLTTLIKAFPGNFVLQFLQTFITGGESAEDSIIDLESFEFRVCSYCMSLKDRFVCLIQS